MLSAQHSLLNNSLSTKLLQEPYSPSPLKTVGFTLQIETKYSQLPKEAHLISPPRKTERVSFSPSSFFLYGARASSSENEGWSVWQVDRSNHCSKETECKSRALCPICSRCSDNHRQDVDRAQQLRGPCQIPPSIKSNVSAPPFSH